MYERFTDRARRVMQLANEEAMRFNHKYIGTEHILLGLVKESTGVAANVLKNLDISLDRVRLEVEKLVGSGPGAANIGSRHPTPRAEKILEYSIEEARKLNHNYVGTEHLLLGLLRDDIDVAVLVLTNLGLSLSSIREEIMTLLGVNRDKPLRCAGLSEGFESLAGGTPITSDIPQWVAQSVAYFETIIQLFNSMKEEAVANQDFDRAAHLRDMADDLKRIRQFLLNERKDGK